MNTPIEELMTVGELKRQLKDIRDDAKIFFGCFSLQFYRLKWRGDKLLQLEFNQSVHDDDQGNVFVDNPSPASSLEE